MAKISIYSVSKEIVDTVLMRKRFMVNLEFYSQDLLDKAIKNGFDKELWEEKNQPNKVYLRY